MTWTNAFDLGSCLVEVFQVATPDVPDYSEILSKGDSADLTLSSWAMHIAVSSNGVITLTNLGSAIEVDVGARIVPAYSLASAQGAQAVLPTSASGAGDASADGAGLASFTNGDASVDLSDQSPYDRISVQTNTIGSSSVNPVVQFTPQFDIEVTPTPTPPSGVYGFHGRLKALLVPFGSSIVVANQWAAETKKRATTIVSSTWTYSGAGTLTSDALTGTQTTVQLTPTGRGVISNTVTLVNGEVLVGTRVVSVERPSSI